MHNDNIWNEPSGNNRILKPLLIIGSLILLIFLFIWLFRSCDDKKGDTPIYETVYIGDTPIKYEMVRNSSDISIPRTIVNKIKQENRSLIEEVSNNSVYGVPENEAEVKSLTIGGKTLSNVPVIVVDNPQDYISIGENWIHINLPHPEVPGGGGFASSELISPPDYDSDLSSSSTPIWYGGNTADSPSLGSTSSPKPSKWKSLNLTNNKTLYFSLLGILFVCFILSLTLFKGRIVVTAGWGDTCLIFLSGLFYFIFLFDQPSIAPSNDFFTLMLILSIVFFVMSIIISVISNMPNPLYIILSILCKVFVFIGFVYLLFILLIYFIFKLFFYLFILRD